MILLIDSGNTRIKWAVLGPHGLGPLHADTYSGWGSVQLRARVLAPAGNVERVVVSNVGGGGIAALLQESVREALGFPPEFIRATRAAGSVRNAYVNAEQLGTDRWAAMIGAFALEAGPVCVVNVGTAMTVDAVDGTGQHLGGVIVPGPDLMISSLMRHTADIAVRAQDGRLGSGLFADNTLGAVYQGSVHALSALVEESLRAMQAACGERPTLVVTGGAADRLQRVVGAPVRLVPDLVLKGLAVLATEGSVNARSRAVV